MFIYIVYCCLPLTVKLLCILSDGKMSYFQMLMNVLTALYVAIMGSVKIQMAPTAASVTKGIRTPRMGKGVSVSVQIFIVCTAALQ